jgi:hypothetical protein
MESLRIALYVSFPALAHRPVTRVPGEGRESRLSRPDRELQRNTSLSTPLSSRPERPAFRLLANASAGRVVEGSWLDVSMGTVAGSILPLPQVSSRMERRSAFRSFASPLLRQAYVK